MRNRRAAFAIVVAGTIAIACAGPVVPAPDASSDLTSPTSVAPSASTSPSPVGGLPQPASTSWFSLDHTFAAPDKLVGFTLTVGTLDGGVTVAVDVPLAPLAAPAFNGALPFAAGPQAGQVLYGWFDGTAAHLAAISTADGSTRAIADRDGVIWHAAVLDAAGASAYVLRIDTDTRDPIGIDHLDMASGELASLVTIEDDRGPQRQQVALRLVLGPNGELVMLDCLTDRQCRATVFDAARGAPLGGFDTVGGDLVGAVGDLLVIAGGCRQPCGPTAYAMSNGGSARVGTMCRGGAVSQLAGRPVLVLDPPIGGRCGIGTSSLQAYDDRGRPRRPAIVLPDSSRDIVAVGPTQGAEVPSGGVLLAPDGQLLDRSASGIGPALVDLITGQLVVLPPIRPAE